MKVLTLDFEGSLKKGIREIGGVLSEKTTITEVYDIKTDNEIEIKKYLIEILSNDVEFIVSHNIHIEKNLVKKYLPYPKMFLAYLIGDRGWTQKNCIQHYIQK